MLQSINPNEWGADHELTLRAREQRRRAENPLVSAVDHAPAGPRDAPDGRTGLLAGPGEPQPPISLPSDDEHRE